MSERPVGFSRICRKCGGTFYVVDDKATASICASCMYGYEGQGVPRACGCGRILPNNKRTFCDPCRDARALERGRAWARDHPDGVAESQDRSRQSHIEQIRARAKKAYHDNRPDLFSRTCIDCRMAFFLLDGRRHTQRCLNCTYAEQRRLAGEVDTLQSLGGAKRETLTCQRCDQPLPKFARRFCTACSVINKHERQRNRVRRSHTRKRAAAGDTAYYPFLNGQLPDDSLLAAVLGVFPATLPNEVRAEVCQEAVKDMLEGVSEADITTHAQQRVRAAFRRLSSYGVVSLDGKDQYGRPMIEAVLDRMKV